MAKLSIKPGSENVSLLVFIQDSASTTGGGKTGLAYNTASYTAYYVRPGAAASSISLVTQTVTGAWSSGGFVEIDSTNMPGVYRFDVPNAVLAVGVRSAVVMLKGASGMAPLVLEVDLGTQVDVALLSGDAGAADNAESFFDGTGYAGTNNVIPTVTTLTGHTAQTGDAFARLGAPDGASVSADVAAVKLQTAAIEADTQDLQAQIGTAGAGLSAADDAVIAAIAALNNLSSAQAQTAATAALNAYDPPTNAEMEARTLVAANYFDPAADVVAHVTLVDTTTTLTNMPAAAPSAADIKTALEADGGKLDHIWEMTEDDGGVRRLTTNALEQAPAGGAGTSDLDELLASHDTEDTLGNVINDLVEEVGGLYRLTTAALAMAPGGGATTYSYSNTVDDGSGNLLDGVFVQCATDTGFTNIVNATHTNSLGAFTVYSDIAGTHYLRLQRGDMTFTDQTVTLA